MQLPGSGRQELLQEKARGPARPEMLAEDGNVKVGAGLYEAFALERPGEFVLEWAASPDHAKRGGRYQTGNFAEPAEACETWIGGERI